MSTGKVYALIEAHDASAAEIAVVDLASFATISGKTDASLDLPVWTQFDSSANKLYVISTYADDGVRTTKVSVYDAAGDGPFAGNEFTSGTITVNGNSAISLITTSASAHQPVWGNVNGSTTADNVFAFKEAPAASSPGGWWNGWGPGGAWLLPAPDALPWRRSRERYIVAHHKGATT